MCGIVGYWQRGGDDERQRRGLGDAVKALARRGPDGSGTWFDGHGVGLGHTRLSIIDLSSAGAQPMACHDVEIVVTFNGEIYNYREIAAELAKKGHTFISSSDTEVVLAAYREWGPACVDRFIGMFAFAIWDGPQGCLRLFRDRIGVKPLYWGWDGRTLCFGSELKALRALPHWQPQINAVAVGEFLQYAYIAAPRTIYQGVHKLMPGHWLNLGREGGPTVRPYWRLADVLAKGERIESDAVLEEELEALVESAFRYRMVADVPVALFLSGGLDSSLVAGVLKRCGFTPQAFTIGFESDRHDESAAARKVAAALGLEHHVARISSREAGTILDQWPTFYDEPFGDHSGIPTYLVARLARERVKVALSADGGDELFCGYGGYPLVGSRMQRFEGLPALARSAGRMMDEMVAGVPMGNGPVGARVKSALGHGLVHDRVLKLSGYLAAASPSDAIRPFRSFFQPREIAAMMAVPYADPRAGAGEWPGEPMERLMATDLGEYLPDDVLVKVDRATMAVGLEGREPLLDHRIVEFAFRLPLRLRNGPLGNKHILRSILYRHVPRPLVDRPKQGFAVPIADWMRDLLAKGDVADSIAVLRESLPMLHAVQLDGAVTAFAGSPQGINRLWLLHALGRWTEHWKP
ncbi:asparagine synthase (glutamine-hydrolyzing) [Rhodomicrobium sp.]|uniref:asparagine synthase (glutamine-hydrolyzing) n=1 Tax=Rhodomicrobium sp. TaxID=2720632 RepID=UPI0039E21C5E